MDKQARIALVGAGGRMGLAIAKIIAGQPSAKLVAAVDRPDAPAAGQDMGTLIGEPPFGVILGNDLPGAAKSADVIIDLSLPLATANVISVAVAAKTPLVCGTTGIDDAILRQFDEAATEIPVLYATNLSPGITLLTALVEQATRALRAGYDIEIVEMHHRNKVDAPSGTAITLAESAARGRGLDPQKALVMGRSGHTGIRPEKEIGMHALRGGGVFGDHTVILASQNERIELTHRASSRTLFAEGAVKAALFLAAQPPGRYTMKDALGM